MKQRRVAILGSTGMLGHIVAQELEADPSFEVVRCGRTPRLGETHVDALDPKTLSNVPNVDYVINCIGLIKQLGNNVSCREWYLVNSVFPWAVATWFERAGAGVIHISTDCVFDGSRGSYNELAPHDARDDYGLSKSRGEPTNVMVLRTSVIGPELRGKLSLLEWALSKRGEQVNGYTNHIWNGLTSYEYANVCKRIILRDLYQHGVYHVFSDSVSKHELLRMIDNAYALEMSVIPTQTLEPCDRTLATVRSLNGELEIPSLREMITEMARRTR